MTKIKPLGQSVFKILLPIAILLLICSNTAKANLKYFILEEETEYYQLFKYELSTRPLYGVDKKVYLYNLMIKERRWENNFRKDSNLKIKEPNIILFSVFPDLEGRTDWVEIALDTIQKVLGRDVDLIKLKIENTLSFVNEYNKDVTKYFNIYKPIVKKGKQYFTPRNCLLEFYTINNRPDIFTNPYGTINTQLTPIHILEFLKIYKKTYPYETFPLYKIGEDNSASAFDRARDRREYLSEVLLLANGLKAYKFWTFADWHGYFHKYIFERGSDRFVYLPGKGIIGGSFDFYFYYHRKKLPIKYADFLDNINEEKVMLADEFL